MSNLKNIFNWFSKSKKICRPVQRAYFNVNNKGKDAVKNRDYIDFSKEGFKNNVIVSRAVKMIANGVSSVNLYLEQKGLNGDICKTKDHPAKMLLENPAHNVSTTKFLESLVSHFLISGNAYICATKKDTDNSISQLSLLRPDRVSVVPDGNSKCYKYAIDNSEYRFPVNNGFSDILHIKNFNPINDWYGLSPLASSSCSIEQYNECIEWNKAILRNGARPSGAIMVKNQDGVSNLTDEQFNQLKEELNDHSSANNAGKILVLEGGLEWQEMSLSPKEMDFLEMKNSAARDIALSLGVPSQLIGIKGDNTYNNIAEARLSFWEETIIPMLKLICNQLSMWLSYHFEEDLIVNFDQDSISALTEKRQKVWQNIGNCSFLTVNEKRQILGFDKLMDEKHNTLNS